MSSSPESQKEEVLQMPQEKWYAWGSLVATAVLKYAHVELVVQNANMSNAPLFFSLKPNLSVSSTTLTSLSPKL
jgi:hypothetical protein